MIVPSQTMQTGPRKVLTRFRAYQLGEKGSSFSYFAAGRFTLVEARVTQTSLPSLRAEMRVCGCDVAHDLHITGWDQDHCHDGELAWILENLHPVKVEYPGYSPHTDCGRNSLELILQYDSRRRARGLNTTVRAINPAYITGLGTAQGLAYGDVFYHPKRFYVDESNNNSTVKVFRAGMFNVASLGDVEHPNIGSMLRGCRIFKSEIDVLILAHHGASNGITTKAFLEAVRPTVAVCTSNRDNEYDHPDPDVRELIEGQGIKLVTTKTGDVLIQSLEPHISKYQVTNLGKDSTAISSVAAFSAKKAKLLMMNGDTIRNRYQPGFHGLR